MAEPRAYPSGTVVPVKVEEDDTQIRFIVRDAFGLRYGGWIPVELDDADRREVMISVALFVVLLMQGRPKFEGYRAEDAHAVEMCEGLYDARAAAA
jgi:hypothetical protein